MTLALPSLLPKTQQRTLSDRLPASVINGIFTDSPDTGYNTTGKPYVLLPGQAIGLDNNYRYAVYRDGHVEHAYTAPAGPEDTEDTYVSASEMASRGINLNSAPKDSHGVPQPGNGYAAAQTTSPGPGGLADALGLGAFTLMTMGLGSAAAAGAGAGMAGGAAGSMSAADAATLGAMTEGGVGAGAGAGLAGGAAADAGVYGLSGIESAAAPGFTYGGGAAGLSTAGAVGGEAGIPVLAGGIGADTLGTSGVDASTGAYAGESANAGAGTYGMGGGGATGAPLPAGGAAYSTPLSRVLAGNGSTADWLSLGGTTLATGLGIYGANEQSNALHDQYSQYLGLGAPSRARYEASFSPNFKLSDIPGFQDALNTTTDTLLRRASTGGNPAGNPGVLAEINRYVAGNLALPTLEQYRNQNAATGGYGAFNSAAPGLGTASINAGAGSLNAAGYGINQLTNPMPTLDQLFRQAQPQNSLA